MSVGENIKKYRKENKLTQKQLADKIGLSEITIRRYEREERPPTIDALNKIATALEIPISNLLGKQELYFEEKVILSEDEKLRNRLEQMLLNPINFTEEDYEDMEIEIKHYYFVRMTKATTDSFINLEKNLNYAKDMLDTAYKIYKKNTNSNDNK